MKQCSKCGETKPLSEFYANKRTKDGHSWYCKECDKSAARVSRAKGAEHERARYGKKEVFGVRKHERHVHTHAGYYGGCLKCRAKARWKMFEHSFA